MVLNTTPTDVPYQRLFLLSNNFFKLYNFASPKLSRLNMLVYEKKYLPNEQWQETIQVYRALLPLLLPRILCFAF